MYTYNISIHISICKYVNMYMYLCICTYIYIYMTNRICIHVCIHTCTTRTRMQHANCIRWHASVDVCLIEL